MKIDPGCIVVSGCRMWRVTGCYYGALGHEDIIGLAALDREPGNLRGADVAEMSVPLALIPQGSVYKPA